MIFTTTLIIESLALGVALAMDAFSVSITDGLNDPLMKKPRMIAIAGCFSFYQIAMPLIGWLCVHTIAEQFRTFNIFIPWIALALLGYIGGKMLIEGIRNSSNSSNGDSSNSSNSNTGSSTGDSVSIAAAAPVSSPSTAKLTFSILMLQGIATSIDALSTGFTIADYGFFEALAESLIIGAVTFVICMTGLLAGKKIGTRLSKKASVLGGVILIAIGLKIFIEGVFF